MVKWHRRRAALARARGRRLPPHGVPIRRLQVLEVVRRDGVVELLDHALEEDQGVADEEVGDVAGQEVVDAGLEGWGVGRESRRAGDL